MVGRNRWIAVLVGLACLWSSGARAVLRVEEVPTFRLRARVVSVGGKDPGGTTFTFHLGRAVSATGSAWSEWLAFDRAQAEAALKAYPNLYLGGYPVVTGLAVDGVVDPTVIEAELQLDEGGETVRLGGELFGPRLGILVWRDEAGRPKAATMAEYNRRYWQVLEGVEVPPERRPKRFPIVDRFIGGDDDRRAWREGTRSLSRAGFSALMLPPSPVLREMLLECGLRRTAWAVYNPPGYAFDYDAEVTPQAIEAWAQKEAKPYLDAGYAREDMALFAMSDEPGWYYPAQFQALVRSPAGLARFREYLKAHKLRPPDLGARRWEDVMPLGRSKATTLPARRLFYWTMRFFAWDSSRHFAVCTRALEKAFVPNLPVLTNWNFFAGRLYVPGAVANNADKQNPDAAMGGHDWLEFGRLRGCTMLWTEDWFPDSMAYQWSLYCARLRCAARLGGVEFGGYVIPRTAGDREDGILQKTLSVVGGGGKAVKYFVFGPEYNFPGNCYSERAHVLRKMAEAHAMIGAAEDLLWPGRPPRPQVAVLAPRSAQMWDARGIALPLQIQDATNTNLNGSTVDYMAEVADLYLALQHANVPVDFVDEDDLSPEGLKPYRVLYVTAPNVPVEGQHGIARWVRSGGTLVTVTGAAAFDRYDEPCRVLARAIGLAEQPRERMLVADLTGLKEAGRGSGRLGAFTAFGPRGRLVGPVVGREATFGDGAPAVLSRRVGRGRAVHFTWMPGLSYVRSASGTRDGLSVGFSGTVRDWISWPVRESRVRAPVEVSLPLVEAPMLLSAAGAAVTLLNWTGGPVASLQVSVRVPFRVRAVESVRRGALSFEAIPGGVRLALPLKAADILLLRP